MPIVALAISIVTGYLLVAAVWPSRAPGFVELLMKGSLAAGFGLGVSSVVFFLVRVLGATHLIVIDASLIALLFSLYAVRHRFANSAAPVSPNTDFNVPKWTRGILTASFLIALLGAFYNSVIGIIAHPHGLGWDAFSIWNLHARFLFLGGTHWRDGFSTLIPWSHADYPLLLPATIAHFWSYLGYDSAAVPAAVGLVFTISALALLASSLALLRGRVAAMLAGLSLASTPFFFEQGTSQYADVPLSFFFLATLVLLSHGWRDGTTSGPFVLAGLAAGSAAWTKNEGLLFLFAVVIAQFRALGIRRSHSEMPRIRNWKSVTAFVMGAMPMLIVIAWFKHSIATPGDLFSKPALMFHNVLTPSRYWIIIQWFAKEFLRFGNWWMIPGTVGLIVLFLLQTPRRKNSSRDLMFSTPTLTLVLTLAGYFAIYIITPRDLYWHLRFSLNRLFLQIWPSAIFLFFLFCRPLNISSPIQTEPNFTPATRETVKKFVSSP